MLPETCAGVWVSNETPRAEPRTSAGWRSHGAIMRAARGDMNVLACFVWARQQIVHRRAGDREMRCRSV